ncbi:hypothetical protein ACHAXA_009642 [Cyclostephanos tholiformis]|uniref:Uncharacterized protein n=1 Tax=Cyclostephanos tholiformis TaxID=382380 RepID=A0ABD3SEG0_9STRA
MSDFAVPDNVKEVISRLPMKDQAVLKAYIAGLRDQLKEYKVRAERTDDDDPHAHYHGHEKCTSDHGHGDHDHKEHDHEKHDHKGHHHKEHDHEDHDHEDHDHMDCGGNHVCDGNHDHEHEHAEHNSHEHKHHEHEHGHGHEKTVEVPGWKKRALEGGADPSAAPFGGSWAAESSLDATK